MEPLLVSEVFWGRELTVGTRVATEFAEWHAFDRSLVFDFSWSRFGRIRSARLYWHFRNTFPSNLWFEFRVIFGFAFFLFSFIKFFFSLRLGNVTEMCMDYSHDGMSQTDVDFSDNVAFPINDVHFKFKVIQGLGPSFRLLLVAPQYSHICLCQSFQPMSR